MRWSAQIVIDQIQKLDRKNSNYAQTTHRNLYQRALHYFGSWGLAVEAAGFRYSQVRVVREFRDWNKKSIAAEIERRQEAGEPLNGETVALQDRGLYNAARRYFGEDGWKKACKLAGVTVHHVSGYTFWSPQLIIMRIRKLKRAGIAIHGANLKRLGHNNLVLAGFWHFGSWRNAVESAGYDYSKIKRITNTKWTPALVLADIKVLHKTGARLSSKKTQSTRADLIQAAIKHFGSWGMAVEAAGINYLEHCNTWSSKHWLAKTSNVEVKRLTRLATNIARKRVNR